MFRFGPDIPIKHFIGQEATWVSLSISSVCLVFDNGDEITIINRDDFLNDNNIEPRDELYSYKNWLGSKVIQIQIVNENMLVLAFENKISLVFADRDLDFENFVFKIAGISYVV